MALILPRYYASEVKEGGESIHDFLVPRLLH